LSPFQLGGTQVTFDVVAVPLVHISQGQINLVTPRSLQAKTTTHLCAVVNDAATNCLDLPVQPAAPDLFLLPGNHAVLNQDGKVNFAQEVAPTVAGLGTTNHPGWRQLPWFDSTAASTSAPRRSYRTI
jgi:uncharacterized protein (TIGR03437 family)